jgi:CRP-like cAMP-binding protein
MIVIMSETSWSHLFDDARPLSVQADAALFRREDAVRFAFLVREGQVALERVLPSGEALVLSVAGPGGLLAEASLFAERYHCDAVARADARIAALPVAILRDRLRAAPGAALGLIEGLSAEVQRQRLRVEILRLPRLDDRLDAWLAVHPPPPRGGWVGVAEAIGVTPPALYRALARRRRAGLTPGP